MSDTRSSVVQEEDLDRTYNVQLVVEDPACTGALGVLDNSTEAPETDSVVVLLVLWIILKLVLYTKSISTCSMSREIRQGHLPRLE